MTGVDLTLRSGQLSQAAEADTEDGLHAVKERERQQLGEPTVAVHRDIR